VRKQALSFSYDGEKVILFLNYKYKYIHSDTLWVKGENVLSNVYRIISMLCFVFHRWAYNEFFDRYRMLIPWKKINWDSLNDTCNTILSTHIDVRGSYFLYY